MSTLQSTLERSYADMYSGIIGKTKGEERASLRSPMFRAASVRSFRSSRSRWGCYPCSPPACQRWS